MISIIHLRTAKDVPIKSLEEKLLRLLYKNLELINISLVLNTKKTSSIKNLMYTNHHISQVDQKYYTTLCFNSYCHRNYITVQCSIWISTRWEKDLFICIYIMALFITCYLMYEK